MMKGKNLLYACMIAITGFYSNAASANTTIEPINGIESKNEIIGNVYQNDNRKPLRDVVVTAYSTATKKEIRAVTDHNGNYSFNDLKPGVYRIVFDRDGYRKVSRDKVLVKTDEGFQLNVGMEEVNDFEWVPGTFNFYGEE
jgi:uncharacterized protein (DUF2141 family)